MSHAYVTLFFPIYNNNNIKQYSFLPSILLIAYIFKTNLHNYDLHTK